MADFNRSEGNSVLNWVNERLSALLDFPVPQALTEYILAIENTRDLENYLRTLLNFNNTLHHQFYLELLQKRQSRLTSPVSDTQGYKKSEVDQNYILPKQNEKKKKGKGHSQTEDNVQKETVKETHEKKKKSKFVNLYSQEGQMKDIILLKGRHHCDCQASKHRLVNNCLKCGRIVCEQEGSGPCLVCNNLSMKMLQVALLLVGLLTLIGSSECATTACAAKSYGPGRTVCVCNATYCDVFEPISALPPKEYVLYSTTKAGLRFERTMGMFSETPSFPTQFIVNSSVTYQTIIGFGAAFTDAVGINIESLSPSTQDKFLRSYFSQDGIELNMGRVPIAGCDFSTHTYTYDDIANDINLTHFNLSVEDYAYKIPLIKKAQQMSIRPLKLLSAAWSAPPWMKTNDDYSGFGFLKYEYYQAWADYLIKFLDAYKQEDLEFWGISTGNEPSNGIIPINRFNSMGWTPLTQRQWVAENFGPALERSQHKNTKLLALDDQRFMLPWWFDIMMSDTKAANYMDGVAVHWYWDTLLPASLLDLTHNHYPDKFILATEASVGDKPWDFLKVKLGSWKRGESYMSDIMQDLNHWVAGWIDWNLALNTQGGPNWANNFVDAAVIINSTADEFYKQPMFYALGHYAKFLPEGSVHIGIEPQTQRGVTTVAFKTPDNAVVVVLQNEKDSNCRVTLEDPTRGFINILVPKRSFNTLVYW